jgi:hypothetical protein
MERSGQPHAPAALPSGKNPSTYCIGGMGGRHSRSGRFCARENFISNFRHVMNVLFFFFWGGGGVISLGLNVMCQRSGTLCSIFIGEIYTAYVGMEQSVPKRRHLQLRLRGIAQKREQNKR